MCKLIDPSLDRIALDSNWIDWINIEAPCIFQGFEVKFYKLVVGV